MLKDIDRICRYINPLIYHYLLDAATMYSKDINLQPFAYKFDVFSTYSNPRHFSSTDTTSAHNTISVFPTPSAFYYYPIRFSSALSTSPLDILNYPLPSILVPLKNHLVIF